MEFDSKLEEDFYRYWNNGKRLKPITGHKFHPVRQWRFDFAWVEHKLAIEIQGYGEGHNSYNGMKTDYEKFNEATLMGWRILFYMAHHINDPVHRRTMINQIGEALEGNNFRAEEEYILPHEKRRRIIEGHN